MLTKWENLKSRFATSNETNSLKLQFVTLEKVTNWPLG